MLLTKKLLVCTNFRANPNNPSCAARNSKQVFDALKRQFSEKNIAVEVEESPCMGYCNIGPNLRLAPNGAFFHGVSASKLAHLVKAAKKFTVD